MNLSIKIQKLIVWLTGYVNLIAFFIAGGYIYLKTDSEDVKVSTKTSFALIAGFTVVDIVTSIIRYIMNLADAGYKASSVMSDIGTVVAIIEAVAFVTLCILDLCGIKLLHVKCHNNNAQEKNDI